MQPFVFVCVCAVMWLPHFHPAIISEIRSILHGIVRLSARFYDFEIVHLG